MFVPRPEIRIATRVGLVGRMVSLEFVVGGALSTNLIDNQLAGEDACAPSTAAFLAKAARRSKLFK